MLEKDSFVSMSELNILEINECGLRTVELGAFNGLRELTVLEMHHNEISDILPGTFEYMNCLEYLDLSYNRIKHLNSAVFSGLEPFNLLTKLKRLLMNVNEITEILPGTFENMSNLEYLDLSYNRIKHLNSAVFSELLNLNQVVLSKNKLQYIHPHTFLGLPNIKRLHLFGNIALQIPTDRLFINSLSLSQLDISYCNISSLSVETLSNISALEWLDLSDNNLRTVDINILRALPELSTLYLHGNRLQCDCQLQEVWRWCEARNIRTVFFIFGPICGTPSEVKGMWWGVLEKGQCLEGNIQYYGDYNITSYSETGIDEQKFYYRKHNNDEIFKQYLVPVNAVLFILGTTCNVILLIIIICNKDMRTVPNMYILNLAISDIIYLTVLFSEACVNGNRTTGVGDNYEFLCLFDPFHRRMTVGLSAYSVALYSFQRYRVIVRPFQVRVSSQRKWRGIVTTFCGVWILAALFAVPSALSRDLCVIFLNGVPITYYQHVVIFELLVSCVLPLCVIAFSYVMTARHLAENSRSISEGTQNPQLKTRRNAAKIVVGLTVVFVISYVPYHVLWTYLICSYEPILSYNIEERVYSSDYKVWYTYLLSNFLLSINSCLNPVALFYTGSHFRQHLKRYITCFCKTSSPSTDFELARRN